MSARELADLIRERKVSAREVMAAHLGQIARVNPKLNAIVAKLDDDRCLALADAADRLQSSGASLGPLHGLPIAIKDTEPAVGFPFTSGSPVNQLLMPAADSELVARLRRAGALLIGKTNVPEFGMGSHTYNKVYGTTFNPYDLTKSAGGRAPAWADAARRGALDHRERGPHARHRPGPARRAGGDARRGGPRGRQRLDHERRGRRLRDRGTRVPHGPRP
jgi:amidase